MVADYCTMLLCFHGNNDTGHLHFSRKMLNIFFGIVFLLFISCFVFSVRCLGAKFLFLPFRLSS